MPARPGKAFWLLAMLAAVLLCVGLLVGRVAVAAPSASCQTWTGAQPPSPGSMGDTLEGVAVLSPCNAWAVGRTASGPVGKTLTEHWNGGAWTVVPSPSPGTQDNFLSGVSAAAPTSIWAVGNYRSSGGAYHTLILHWNGHGWAQVGSPIPGANSFLSGIHVVTGTSAWAVGGYGSATYSGNAGYPAHTLILHWNGRNWSRIAAPNPGAVDWLTSVAGSSSSNVWAVGGFASKDGEMRTLVMHWNGRGWSQVPSPSPLTPDNFLGGVSATSGSDVWVVGGTTLLLHSHTLVLHWNGRHWTRVSAPSPGTSASLSGVIAFSASDAWAVGGYAVTGGGVALLTHWDGKRWARTGVSMPPGGIGSSLGLLAIAAAGARDVWTVGSFYTADDVDHPLALHCC
jgi:hypothetical protein